MSSSPLSRRQVLKTALMGGAVLAVASRFGLARAATTEPDPSKVPEPSAGPFKLPPLPYAFGALEPILDAKTMEIHHDKHHAAYVAGLNKAVADHPDLQKKTAEELIRNLDAVPEAIRTAVRRHGGGHVNHSLFWRMLAPPGNRTPEGALGETIRKSFGSPDHFQEAFGKAAASVFGSGWAWLSLGAGKELLIETTPNQDSPFMHGHVPLLGLDVWEHAYYLKHQNRRADYIAAFPQVINWSFVGERFIQANGAA